MRAVGIAALLAIGVTVAAGCGGGTTEATPTPTPTSTRSVDVNHPWNSGAAFYCPVNNMAMAAALDVTVVYLSRAHEKDSCFFDSDPKVMEGGVLRLDGYTMARARKESEKPGCVVHSHDEVGAGAFTEYCPRTDTFPEGVQVVLQENGAVWAMTIKTMGEGIGQTRAVARAVAATHALQWR